MMHMTFYWGRSLILLFDSWKTDSWVSYSLTLVVLFIFSVFYQYLEDRRLRLKIASSPKSSSPSITTPLISRGSRNLPRLAVALLFGINSAVGYLLMLSVMSYNGGVFVAVVLGLTVGYLAFRCNDEDIVVVDNPCACA